MSSESTSRRPSPSSRRTALVVAVCVVAMIVVVAAALTERKPAAHSAAPSTIASSTTVATATTSTTMPPVTVPPTTSAPTTAPTTTTTRPRATTSTSASTAPPAPVSGSLHGLAGKTIVIDPGHDGGNASHTSEINRPIFIGTGYRNCNTVGTETNGGYPEHAYTFDVALRVRAILESAGARVVMTRTNDTGVGPCIDVRAAIGNQAHAGAVVAIHADGGPATGRGSCVYMPSLTPGYTDDIYAASHRLGVALRDGYRAVSGVPTANYVCSDGLAEANNYGGLNLSNVPAVLFETVNMRNATDAAYIGQSSDRQRIAEGIAAGLARYFSG